jgi:hypothetical protein
VVTQEEEKEGLAKKVENIKERVAEEGEGGEDNGVIENNL